MLVVLLTVAHAFAPLKTFSARPTSTLSKTEVNLLNFNFGGSAAAAGSKSIPSSKKICVITGTTSGLGKETMRSLLDDGDYYVVSACRDVEKMNQVAAEEGFDPKSFTVLECDLSSFESTKKFASTLRSTIKRPLDALVCNAALYQPALDTVSYSIILQSLWMIYLTFHINFY